MIALRSVPSALASTGEVRITATTENGHFAVSVADTGPGIPADQLTRVFEQFHQVDSSNTKAKGGTGLARAFFYAGGRALLVSHWQVDSESAVRLTTSTFDALKQDPAIGRAEALRRAMLAMIEDPSNIWNAYPDYWGPFSIVGAGGRP